jgi:Family of unknown function (DUF6529)
MEELITNLTRGNVTEVKVALASIVTALACYQVALMAVGYGKVRLRFLAADPASRAHRAIGDGIVVITVMVATMCISYFELEDDATAHVIAAISLLVLLALKIVVIRWIHGLSRLLPAIGLAVWVLFAVTFATSAGDFLATR